MDSAVPAPFQPSAVERRRPTRFGGRPRLGELMHSPKLPPSRAQGPPIFSRLTLSHSKYKTAGGKMSPSILGKVMASKPSVPIKQMAGRLNKAIGGTLGEVELELCARYFQLRAHRISRSEMGNDCPEREKVLEEVRCLFAASELR